MLPLLFAPLANAVNGAGGWRSFGLRGETVKALSIAELDGKTVFYAQTPSGLWRRIEGEAAILALGSASTRICRTPRSARRWWPRGSVSQAGRENCTRWPDLPIHASCTAATTPALRGVLSAPRRASRNRRPSPSYRGVEKGADTIMIATPVAAATQPGRGRDMGAWRHLATACRRR